MSVTTPCVCIQLDCQEYVTAAKYDNTNLKSKYKYYFLQGIKLLYAEHFNVGIGIIIIILVLSLVCWNIVILNNESKNKNAIAYVFI